MLSTSYPTKHSVPHFNQSGICVCPCEVCTSHLEGLCICMDCPCETVFEHGAIKQDANRLIQ
jgi:hypothetical protein